MAIIHELREEGLSLRAIDRELRRRGFRSRTGGRWHVQSLANIIRANDVAAAGWKRGRTMTTKQIEDRKTNEWLVGLRIGMAVAEGYTIDVFRRAGRIDVLDEAGRVIFSSPIRDLPSG